MSSPQSDEQESNMNYKNLQNEHKPCAHLGIPKSSADEQKSNISLLSQYSKKPLKIHRSMIFVTFSAWMTFASILLFQANLLNHIESNWSNDNIPEKQKSIFEHGVSSTFFGTFIFRIGHEIFWSSFSCKTRVVLSLCCLITSMMLLCIIYFIFSTKYTFWIIFINFIGGIGVGAIEPNLLTSILPLGDDTKVWAFYGISIGFNFMAVIGFYLLSIDIPLYIIYTTCSILCFISIFIYLRIIDQTPSFLVTNDSLDIIVQPAISINLREKEDYKTSMMRLRELKLNFKEYKQWFYILLPYGVFLTLDLFAMNFFCTVSLYVFYDGKIPLFTNIKNGTHFWINRDLYFALSGVANAIFQIIGNRTSYYTKFILKIGQKYPFCFIIFQLLCGLLCSCVYFIQPFITLFGIAGVYLMNGAIYSSGVKYIDTKIDKKYNLISLSVWLIFADIGSIIGQNTFEPIVKYVCNNSSTPSYYC